MTRAGIAEVLERAADRLEPEDAWTQGCEGPHGSTCAGLAIMMQHGDIGDRRQAMSLFAEQVAPPRTDICAIYRWNDAPERTQEEVVSALRAAATLARHRAEGSTDA